MQLRNHPTIPIQLPTKVSVRVLRQNYSSQTNQPVPHKLLRKNRFCPPNHIQKIVQCQQSIQPSPKRANELQENIKTQHSTSAVKRRRRKIFECSHSKQKMIKNPNKQSGTQKSSYSPECLTGTFRKYLPDPQLINGQETVKQISNSSLNRPPTVKDLSPKFQGANEIAYQLGKASQQSKASIQQSSRYYSPSNNFSSNINQSRNQMSPKNHERRLSTLESSHEKHEKQLQKLSQKVNIYYAKSQQSQKAVLTELNKSSHNIINKQKEAQLNLIKIKKLEHANSSKTEQLDRYKLQLQRSKRVEQLSLYNEKLYQSLLQKSQTQTQDYTTRYEDYDDRSSPLKKQKVFDRSYVSKKCRNSIDSVNYSIKQHYFPNSISGLYSPARENQPYENDDTLTELLSPLLINPDYL